MTSAFRELEYSGRSTKDNALVWQLVKKEGIWPGIILLFTEWVRIDMMTSAFCELEYSGHSTKDNALVWQLVKKEGIWPGIILLLTERVRYVDEEEED